jgi:chorismate mutase
METKLNTLGGKFSKRKGPLIIAGPCSAETEEQLMETAGKLVKTEKIDIFRAGIWKPRTRPSQFEGVGVIGLKWLKEVKQKYQIPVGTEVATEKHVYEALKYGIDVLWIGSRTAADPFAVQAVADALQGVDVTVLVKNPVNPDLELWIGAIERVQKAGITSIGAIHRGFTSYEKIQYRNAPKWQIAIELQRRIPWITLINDPSHIAGNAAYLKEISQKALDLGYGGLMIESHCNPERAWSDGKQQITPDELVGLLDSLVYRKVKTDDNSFTQIVDELRNQIDVYDDQLLELVEQRMNIAEVIGKFKKEHKVTILQSGRWDSLLKTAVEKGQMKGLSAVFINALFKAIHQESINHQAKVMDDKLN